MSLICIKHNGEFCLVPENPLPSYIPDQDEEEDDIYDAVARFRHEQNQPIKIDFEANEGEKFNNNEVILGFAYRDNTKDPEGEYPGFTTDEDDIPSWCPYHRVYTKNLKRLDELMGDLIELKCQVNPVDSMKLWVSTKGRLLFSIYREEKWVTDVVVNYEQLELLKSAINKILK